MHFATHALTEHLLPLLRSALLLRWCLWPIRSVQEEAGTAAERLDLRAAAGNGGADAAAHDAAAHDAAAAHDDAAAHYAAAADDAAAAADDDAAAHDAAAAAHDAAPIIIRAARKSSKLGGVAASD